MATCVCIRCRHPRTPQGACACPPLDVLDGRVWRAWADELRRALGASR